MSTYRPDSWVPILIESEEDGKIYKVLASWYGGFAGSNYWKLSSGIESVSQEQGELIMPQSSGSVYITGVHTHMSSMMGGVYFNLKEGEADGNYTVKIITVEELLEAFKQ